MNFSPRDSNGLHDSNHLYQSGDDIPNEDYIKVKLFFYTENKILRERVFTDEWYTVMSQEYEDASINRDTQPWIEFEVMEHNTFGEMLMVGIQEVNEKQKEIQSDLRFQTDLKTQDTGEDLYDIYMAKVKKGGKPKDDYPNQDLQQLVKEANVENNTFTVVYTEWAIQEVKPEPSRNDSPVKDANQSANQVQQNMHRGNSDNVNEGGDKIAQMTAAATNQQQQKNDDMDTSMQESSNNRMISGDDMKKSEISRQTQDISGYQDLDGENFDMASHTLGAKTTQKNGDKNIQKMPMPVQKSCCGDCTIF